jgi:hypothetical protein
VREGFLQLNWWHQIPSLFGAFFCLLSFIMLQLVRPGWGAKDWKYLSMCVLGGSCLVVSSILDKNIGFTLLNTIYTALALIALI